VAQKRDGSSQKSLSLSNAKRHSTKFSPQNILTDACWQKHTLIWQQQQQRTLVPVNLSNFHLCVCATNSFSEPTRQQILRRCFSGAHTQQPLGRNNSVCGEAQVFGLIYENATSRASNLSSELKVI
jgi:hypothetical protein